MEVMLKHYIQLNDSSQHSCGAEGLKKQVCKKESV